MSDAALPLTLAGIRGLPEFTPGTDLAARLIAALATMPPAPLERDVLVVAQKIVSKAEGRLVDLASVVPGARAQELAAITRKDARLVEVILSESTEVVRATVNVLIVRHRLGFVLANAGVDRSNVLSAAAREPVLLLPRDPDASAAALRRALQHHFGAAPGVIISDSFGRPWRMGVVNVALGAAGITALLNRRGEPDRSGRPLEATDVAIADALAAAAGLVMGEAAEGIPAVLIRGLQIGTAAHSDARSLIRPVAEDLFR
jgi:coenzyme F420-0:L-glutamate ligase / coenzyme F420-1:gamma-L-glutamate ligase